MEISMLLEYGWVLVILIFLEGLLSADNALVLAIMAKHLPKDQQTKAINMGLLVAFVFRFGAIFIISYLFDVWQIQAIGAAYLIVISLRHLLKKDHKNHKKRGRSFAVTVMQISLADIAFAVDSILAAVALVITLPETPFVQFGGMDGAQFIVILIGAISGLLIIRFAAGFFVKILTRRPSLETAAMLIVGWVGVKLLVHTLAHPALNRISHDFVEGPVWNVIFWTVMLLIAIGGWFLSKEKKLAAH
ncbi:TerC family protein [Neobacillus sp. Marseille-QA0830]